MIIWDRLYSKLQGGMTSCKQKRSKTNRESDNEDFEWTPKFKRQDDQLQAFMNKVRGIKHALMDLLTLNQSSKTHWDQ